jgi:hypothetical protein
MEVSLLVMGSPEVGNTLGLVHILRWWPFLRKTHSYWNLP